MRRLAAALIVIAAASASSRAHETWILPSSCSAGVGETVHFDVTSGMEFPAAETPIRIDRIERAGYRQNGAMGVITRFESAPTSLVLRNTFDKPGLATVWVDLKPRDIDLTDDQVAEYLDEIGAGEAIRNTWAARRGRMPWHETYTKHLKTFVAVGDKPGGASWSFDTGSGLELVPETNPCASVAGRALTVTLRARSKPVASAAVGLMVEGSKERTFVTTDALGKATFSLPREGIALLFAVSLRLTDDEKGWVSDFATLTFEVAP